MFTISIYGIQATNLILGKVDVQVHNIGMRASRHDTG